MGVNTHSFRMSLRKSLIFERMGVIRFRFERLFINAHSISKNVLSKRMSDMEKL
jgi:hypothetical protein